MTEMIISYLDKIKVGAEQSYKNLAMFPLLSCFSPPCNYLTMNESWQNGTIEKDEIDEKRSTPKRKVINKSNEIILFSDGKKSAGINLNRRIISSVLSPTEKAVVVPEKCGDQSQSSCNPNQNHRHGRVAASWDYIEQFARVDGQIGAIFLINGKLAGMVCFRSPEEFKKSFIKIVECYARKADDEYDPKIDPKPSKSEVTSFLKTPIESGIEIQSAAGL